ncbi:MAG: hypothetical protein EXR76_01115 [Myxococcales bacterium]|nr:hypothetical protein [Myxococcales bacterium]
MRNVLAGRALVALAMTLGALAMAGCKESSPTEATKAESAPILLPPTCAQDEDCKHPKYVCMYERCLKGQRTEAEKLAMEDQRRADAEKAKVQAEADRPPGPGEGRLKVRICPFVRRTGQTTSLIVAKNLATGLETSMKIEDEMPFNDVRSEFTFKKLPLGEYEVRADYGVRVGDKRDVIILNCDKKAKPCVAGTIRKITVVPVDQEVAPKIDKETGKPEKRACDWVAE